MALGAAYLEVEPAVGKRTAMRAWVQTGTGRCWHHLVQPTQGWDQNEMNNSGCGEVEGIFLVRIGPAEGERGDPMDPWLEQERAFVVLELRCDSRVSVSGAQGGGGTRQGTNSPDPFRSLRQRG